MSGRAREAPSSASLSARLLCELHGSACHSGLAGR